MPKVHILKEDVISKIAAGEVIERPASVIKELVENALDAGADSIEVTLADAGKTLIKIKDTGHGIERDNLEKIFARHATSKITNADDLYNIQSLGFRGEALYSIGAIADVTLRSRGRTMCAPTGPGPDDPSKKDVGAGWQIHVRGGKRLDLRPCAMPGHGTEIEVKELFFNTPARRKFLKSDTTEVNQILNTFIPYALLHSNIRFQLTHQDRDLVDVAPCGEPKSRVAHLLHVDERHLTDVRQEFAEYGLKAHLILGDINIKRSRRDMQFIFVNSRPVQNKAIGFHLNQVYRLIMPADLYPLFVVSLQLPAKEIDVNIHPAKREVKIREEQKVCSILRELCEQTLMRAGETKQIRTRHAWSVQNALETHIPQMPLDASLGTEIFETARDYAYPSGKDAPDAQQFFIPSNVGNAHVRSLHNRLDQASYVGLFINKYLLFQVGNADLRSLLVVDQHAAAERITYERLIRQMNQGAVEVQRLLSPILLKLSIQETLIWEESQEQLNALGLETNQWDKETMAVHSYPTFLKDIEKAVRYILGGETIARGDHDTLARRACRSSVMAGDVLKPEQADHMRRDLIACLDPFTCPHGRPTVIELSEDFLDKQFLRVK